MRTAESARSLSLGVVALTRNSTRSYKNQVGSRRASLRTLSSVKKTEESVGNEEKVAIIDEALSEVRPVAGAPGSRPARPAPHPEFCGQGCAASPARVDVEPAARGLGARLLLAQATDQFSSFPLARRECDARFPSRRRQDAALNVALTTLERSAGACMGGGGFWGF